MSHFFKIDSLLTTHQTILDVGSTVGDDHGGIAVSGASVFLNGDDHTGLFESDLPGGALGVLPSYDGIVGNIANGAIYAMSPDGANPLVSFQAATGTRTITTLNGIDGATGGWNQNNIQLSQAITISYGSQVYSGFNRIDIWDHDTGHVFDIDLLTGNVADLGPLAQPAANLPEAWASWGVAEFFGGELYLDYAAGTNTIERIKVSDGTVTTIATLDPSFADLHEFAVLPGSNRWYFHYETGTLSETLGFADASFEMSATIISGLGADELPVSVSENTTAVTTVVGVASTSLTYQILNTPAAPDGAKFAIDQNGVLTFLQAPDFEAPTDAGQNNVYDVLVGVSVTGEADSMDTQLLHITVANTTDTIAGGPVKSVQVAENTTAVTTIAADDDVASLTYQIVGGADAAKFAIDASSGGVTFLQAPDFETPADADHDNVYDLVVQLSENGVASDTQTLHVAVSDAADETLVGGDPRAIAIVENSSAVATLAATGGGPTLGYTIVGGADAAKFTLTGGALSFTQAPDFEAPADADHDNVYDVIVQLLESGQPSDTQAIHVLVGNLADEAITGGDERTLAVAENSATVTTLAATSNGPGLSYQIAGGADAAKFVLAADGTLSLAGAPDFEARADADHDNVYDVAVQLVENGLGSDIQTLHVAVTNVAGVTINGTNKNDLVDAAHSLAGQALPTGEEDVIAGGSGRDWLSGLAGDDTLIGRFGKDALTGGEGHDSFVFDRKLVGPHGIANFDKIIDFTVGEDMIVLDHRVFKALAVGPLAPSAFHHPPAANGGDHILYAANSGKLLYDADGKGGAEATLIAVLAGAPDLSAADIVIA